MPYLHKSLQWQEQRYPFLAVCAVFYLRVFKQCYGCQWLGFLTCAQMLMCGIENEGGTDSVKESALEVDTGRKIPCCTWGLKPVSVLHLAFRADIPPLSYPGPIPYTWKQRSTAHLSLGRQWSCAMVTYLHLAWPPEQCRRTIYLPAQLCTACCSPPREPGKEPSRTASPGGATSPGSGKWWLGQSRQFSSHLNGQKNGWMYFASRKTKTKNSNNHDC